MRTAASRSSATDPETRALQQAQLATIRAAFDLIPVDEKSSTVMASCSHSRSHAQSRPI